MNALKKNLVLLPVLLAIVLAYPVYRYFNPPPILVGVMHSLTGDMAISEESMVDAVRMAVEELNKQGGLLGRELVLVVKDGQSDPVVFAAAAEELITKDKVDVVFGCWTSSCRKSVLPVFEQHDHLLYYPLQYEGMESSKNIIYLGALPNQQILPALEWSFSKYGKRIYLVGSDYVYPHAANQVVKDQAKKWLGTVVGESYAPLGSERFEDIVADIVRTRPDTIFNTINGSSNPHFFRALRAAGISPKMIPTFSFSVSEEELDQFSDINMQGDLLSWNYLQNLDNDVNRKFVSRFKARFGSDRKIGNAMQVAYLGVAQWAKAVRNARSSDPDAVRPLASDLSINGPAGMVYIEEQSQHTWKTVHIAEITESNQLRSIWFSKIPIAPKPFPGSRAPDEWLEFIDGLKEKWGGQWQATAGQ